MATNYRLTPDVQSDLVEIRQYTEQEWGLAQSRKYLSGLRNTIRLLAESPFLGKSRPEVGATVFNFPHAEHVIYYLALEPQIVVFGVLHKRMVPSKHLMKRQDLHDPQE